MHVYGFSLYGESIRFAELKSHKTKLGGFGARVPRLFEKGFGAPHRGTGHCAERAPGGLASDPDPGVRVRVGFGVRVRVWVRVMVIKPLGKACTG